MFLIYEEMENRKEQENLLLITCLYELRMLLPNEKKIKKNESLPNNNRLIFS